MVSKSVLNNISHSPKALNRFVRVYPDQYSDAPLGVGKGNSRFGREDFSFQVLYMAETLETAFVETVVRNRFDRKLYATLYERELEGFRVAEIRSLTKLNLVDLTGNKMIRDRLRSGIVGNTDHRSGRSFSRILRETRPDIDGILYPSRLIHDKVCIAIYDHAIQKLDAENGETLNQDQRMPGIMSGLNIKRIRN